MVNAHADTNTRGRTVTNADVTKEMSIKTCRIGLWVILVWQNLRIKANSQYNGGY